jgi:hypothetical protein
VIEWDAEPGIERHAYTLGLETVTPLEDIAAIGKKNPKGKVSVGSRVSTFPQYNISGKKVYGTVTYVGRGIHAEFVSITLDTGEHYDRHASDVELLNPLEDLAALGKTMKNPKGPNLQNTPRAQIRVRIFELGDRVRCRNYSPDSFGTVRGFSGSMKGWIGVEFDLRPLQPGEPLEAVHESDLEHVTPLEELAALGKQKKNPKPLGLSIGTRVKVEHFFGFDPGTVAQIFTSGMYSVELDSGVRQLYPESMLTPISPIEELALLGQRPKGTKKNPTTFEPGTRVRVEYRPLRGTVTRMDEGWVVVSLDSGEEAWFSPQHLIALSPLEELARLSRKPRDSGKLKPRAKKNPSEPHKAGDRVKYDELGLFGTLTRDEYLDRDGYRTVVVLFDGYRLSLTLRVRNLERVTPLEELALLGATGKKAKKNPENTFRIGERVRRTSGPWKRRVGRITAEGLIERAVTGNYLVAHVLFDGALYSVVIPHRDLQSVSPLEELALVKTEAKKNPSLSPLLSGDRVNSGGKFGTVVRDEYLSKSFGVRTVVVMFDGELRHTFLNVRDVERTSPLEDLASTAKKNPNFEAGDRVLCRNHPIIERVGTVVEVHERWAYVDIDDSELFGKGGVTQVFLHELRHINPLEELASVSVQSRKNPVGPAFKRGDRVKRRLKGSHNAVAGTIVQEAHLRGLWHVAWDDSSGVSAHFTESLESINPLEDLSMAHRPTKSNPADRPPLGSTARITKGPYAGRVGEVVTVRTPFTAWQIRVPNGEVWNVQDTEGLEALTPLEELALLGAEIRKKGRR